MREAGAYGRGVADGGGAEWRREGGDGAPGRRRRPDAVDDRGTPALCLAVDGFDLATVEVLMRSARLDRVTDGQTRCCGRSTAAPPTS
ncbi:hypothetical protein O1M63_40925 [Streptomyces mirabilis]|nr:hypothetical protein [Streptomyces mirabilis]